MLFFNFFNLGVFCMYKIRKPYVLSTLLQNKRHKLRNTKVYLNLTILDEEYSQNVRRGLCVVCSYYYHALSIDRHSTHSQSHLMMTTPSGGAHVSPFWTTTQIACVLAADWVEMLLLGASSTHLRRRRARHEEWCLRRVLTMSTQQRLACWRLSISLLF